MPEEIILTDRDLDEIAFCLMYATGFSHGSDGHFRMRVVAKLARLCTDPRVSTMASALKLIPDYKPKETP